MAKKGKAPKYTENQKAVLKIINDGIESLIKDNPRFENYQDYLKEHIDVKGIEKKFNDIYYDNTKNKSMKPQDARMDAYARTSMYVESGSLLDEKGKKVIAREGKLEARLFDKIFHRPRSQGEIYLNKVADASHELLKIAESGKYNVPEMTKPLMKLQKLGFASPAIAILSENGLIDKSREKYLMKHLYDRVDEGMKEVNTGIEKYVVPEKVAAAVIGFIGVFLMLSNINVTGAIIGENSTISIGIVGVFMIFFALLLYLRPFKKGFKK